MRIKSKKLVEFLIIFIAILVIHSPYSDSMPVPHGIDGIVYELDGITQVPPGIGFSVNDTTTGEYIQGKTGHGSSGRYSVSLNGNDGDFIIIKAWNKVHSTNITIELQGVMHNVNLLLNMSMPNYAPEIISIPIINSTQDEAYIYDVEAFDENDDLLSYSLPKHPEGMVIDTTSGLIVWTPINEQAGENEVIIEVSDGELTDTQEFTINVKNVNDKPIITSTPITTALEDSLYTYNVDAIDLDNDELIYILTTAPSGMTINSTNGLISWLPLNNNVGINNVTVSVNDGFLSDEQSFTINVENVNDKPVIISIPTTTATQNVQYTYDVDAIDEDSDILSYYLITKPDGMIINQNTGAVSWIPTNEQVGENKIIVEVSDGELSNTQEFIINVSNVNDIPIITSTPITNAIQDLLYSYDVDAVDPDNDILTYSLVIYPEGMIINKTTGLIAWTPTNEQVGISNVTIAVSDNEGTSTQSFIIDVENVNDKPSIISTPITNVMQDAQYTYDLDAVDPDDDILTYSLIKSPAGMVIDVTSGLIMWTPTNEQVGFNNVTVQVSDGDLSDMQNFTINVENVNDKPVIISTPTTNAELGETYIYDVNATDPDGGSLSYSLLIKPQGMSIQENNGLIEWKPKGYQKGNNTIAVQVSDGNLTAIQSFGIYVVPRLAWVEEIIIKTSGGGYSVNEQPRETSKSKTNNMEKTTKPSNTNNFIVSFKKISQRPRNTKSLPKRVYQYLTVEDGMEKIGEDAVIKFSVEKSWIFENGFNESDMVLSGYAQKEWTDLPTSIVDEDDDLLHYQAKIYNFSYFAITVKEEAASKAASLLKPIISKIEAPYRISGALYDCCGFKQINGNTSFVVRNLNNNKSTHSKTGIGKNSGTYYTLINANYGDPVEITVEGVNQSFRMNITGDIDNLNFMVNKRKGEFKKITGFITLESKIECLLSDKISWLIFLMMLAGLILINKFIYKNKKSKDEKKRNK